MTDPTPTRAEVDIARFDPCPFGGAMTLDPSGDYVRHDDYQALRERAEAAEAERDTARSENAVHERFRNGLRDQLTAARRTEAAAWNDAIEAARPVAITCFASGCDAHELDDAIRALRRAAPTEGEA